MSGSLTRWQGGLWRKGRGISAVVSSVRGKAVAAKRQLSPGGRLASCGARRRLMAPPQLLTLSVPQACQPSQGTGKASIQVRIGKMHKNS